MYALTPLLLALGAGAIWCARQRRALVTKLRQEAAAREVLEARFRDTFENAGEQTRSIEQFRQVIEAAPTGMLMIDAEGKIVLVNSQIEKLFGYPRQELTGQSVEMLVPSRYRRGHAIYRRDHFGSPRARPMGMGRDLFALRQDGAEIPIEIGLNPLHTSQGEFVLSSVIDITERKRTEQEKSELLLQLQTLNAQLEQRVAQRTSDLSTALKEREVLLQEIHHRVKNNLQVISSLINVQLSSLTDRSNAQALEDCRARVAAIALIHEKLYQSRDYAQVPFSEYARSLVRSVFATSDLRNSTIKLDLAIDELSLSVEAAVPCGLILNELVTNALKHAFKNRASGTIAVWLRIVDSDQVRLTVKDDGVGFDKKLDLGRPTSLGMQLVTIFAEQLDARLDMSGDGGAAFELTFPLHRSAPSTRQAVLPGESPNSSAEAQ